MDWKEEILVKRRSQASTCVLIQTGDPKRVEQIREFVAYGDFERKYNLTKVKNILWIDPVEPVFDMKTDKAIEQEQGIFGSDLVSSINMTDKKIKSGTSIVVFNNITNQDLARSLALNIQNWAYHPELFGNRSTVFIITPDIMLFDDITRKHCIIIEPPFSTESERKEIFDKISKTLKAQYEPLLVSVSAGLNLHDLETTILEGFAVNQKIDLQSITKAKMDLMKRYGFELTYPNETWDWIGGYDSLKEYFQNNVIKIIKDNTAREWGIMASRGILLFGLGGTGKTLFAKCLAREMQLPFIKISSADLFRGIVGSTEAQIKNLQKVAEENAPCIIFIDEIDALGMKRENITSTDSGVSRRAINLLMDWLGDSSRKSIIVGATNLIEQMDEAFLRSGRFDTKLAVMLPDYDARKQIVNVHAKIVRKIPTSFNYDSVAERTQFWSGAELELLVCEASRIARMRGHDKVMDEDVDEAFGTVAVNTEKREGEFRNFLRVAKEYSNNRKLLDEQLKEFMKKEKTKDRLEVFKEMV